MGTEVWSGQFLGPSWMTADSPPVEPRGETTYFCGSGGVVLYSTPLQKCSVLREVCSSFLCPVSQGWPEGKGLHPCVAGAHRGSRIAANPPWSVLFPIGGLSSP